MKGKLPYSQSSTQPHLSEQRIKKLLQKFEVSQVNFCEDFDNKQVVISFVFKRIPISLPVNYQKLGMMYQRQFSKHIGNTLKERFLATGRNAAYAGSRIISRACLSCINWIS